MFPGLRFASSGLRHPTSPVSRLSSLVSRLSSLVSPLSCLASRLPPPLSHPLSPASLTRPVVARPHFLLLIHPHAGHGGHGLLEAEAVRGDYLGEQTDVAAAGDHAVVVAS